MFKLIKENCKDTGIKEAIVEELIKKANTDDKIVALDSDLMLSSGLNTFQEAYPDRAFDLGIMEANTVGVAGGLASMHYKVFLHTFAPFAARRDLDQLYLVGAYGNLPITVLATDPGLAAQFNGGTHTSLEDISIFRAFFNTSIFDVADSAQARWIINYRIENQKELAYIRYARKGARKIYEDGSSFEIGKFPVVQEGKDITIFASGIMLTEALNASDLLKEKGISIRIVDCFCLSHIDEDVILDSAKNTKHLLALDNHNSHGGLASIIADTLVDKYPCKLYRMGMETFGEVGTLAQLLQKHHLDANAISQKILDIVKND